MQDVTVAWPCGGQAFVDQLNALTQRIVCFEHLGRWRHIAQVFSLHHQSLKADISGKLIEVCALGIGQQQRLGGVIDPRSIEQLAIGADLQQFANRIALQRCIPVVAHVRPEGRQVSLEECLEVEVFQHLRRGQRRKIHTTHAVTSRIWLLPRYCPLNCKVICPAMTDTTRTRSNFRRGSQRPRERATSACTALFQPSLTGRSTKRRSLLP
ncbi:hypothetical protein D3C72_1420310 [compost metagenome]